MTAAVDFRLLGPLEIVSDGQLLPIPPGKQRVLLALLLLRRNQHVPVRELGEKLWDHGAPANPRAVVQKYVMRLRRALRPTGCLIRTESESYCLELRPGMLDVDRFAEKVDHGMRAAGAGQLEAASVVLADALALWRAVPRRDGRRTSPSPEAASAIILNIIASTPLIARQPGAVARGICNSAARYWQLAVPMRGQDDAISKSG